MISKLAKIFFNLIYRIIILFIFFICIMNTVAILPMSNASGEKSYRAISEDKQSVGKTADQGLDALTIH
jgi:hypothetical protein